ncbi:flagellar hook-length control protein FliK [Thermodesulfobacteriota bacterium]
MQDPLQFNLLPLAVDEAPAVHRRTPADIGNSLFEDLLRKNTYSAQPEDELSSHYSDNGSRSEISDKSPLRDIDTWEKMDEKVRDLGVPMSQLVLPQSALSPLISFLEKQGMTRSAINQMIRSATDQQGLVHLDKLLSRMMNENSGKGIQGHIIQSRFIPQVQEILFNMGLGAGETKEAIEKSINAGGELILGRLSSSLGKYFGKSFSPEEMHSLLKRLGIETKPRVEDGKSLPPDLRELFKVFSESASQNPQKDLKQNIANLMREKGFAPQEIKSFLEGLTPDSVRALHQRDGSPPKLNPEFLSHLIIRPNSDGLKASWREKMLDALNKEGLWESKNTANSPLEDMKPFRFNLTELMKAALQKGQTDPRDALATALDKLHAGATGALKGLRELRSGQKVLQRPSFGENQDKENMVTHQVSPRGARGTATVFSVDNPRNAHAMPDPLPKILDRMILMIRGGQQSSRISISPPELGRLNIDLVIRQGHLQADLSTESGLAKEIIEANLHHLKQQLTSQGLVVDKLEVMVGFDDRRFLEGENRTTRDWKGRSSRKSAAKNPSPIPEKSPLRPSPDHNNQIDIIV